MKVEISDHEYTIIWDGIYYFALSDYPNISDWELKKIISFIGYEKANDRETEISCKDEGIMRKVNYAINNPDAYMSVSVPERLTECTACKQGACHTDYLLHTSSVESAKKILESGKLLSGRLAIKNSSLRDKRNAAGDPEDYFEYIMLSWGNCQAGDRLVTERLLERMPANEDLGANFKPGARFYFRYDDISNHHDHVFDGYHAAKIKDSLELEDYMIACVIPLQFREELEDFICENLSGRVHYIDSDGLDIWEWSEKVYEYIRKNVAI